MTLLETGTIPDVRFFHALRGRTRPFQLLLRCAFKAAFDPEVVHERRVVKSRLELSHNRIESRHGRAVAGASSRDRGLCQLGRRLGIARATIQRGAIERTDEVGKCQERRWNDDNDLTPIARAPAADMSRPR